MTTTDLQVGNAGARPGSGDGFDDLARNSSLALEEAAAALDLESWIIERLRHPVEETTSYLQLLRDSGDAVCVRLFRVQHSGVFGSSIGSLTLRPDLQLHTCEAIAMERTWQAALLGLPFDGASYGLVCDSDELSERELMRLLGSAALHLRFQPGRQSIVLPGVGCPRECMAKLFAETRQSGHLSVTGKPDCLGGLDLDRFTAEGIAAIVLAELRRIGKAPATAKVAIQGFGSLGQCVSERLLSEGLTLIALSDSSGGLHRADGLILSDILSRYDREPILLGYSQAESISRAELLQLKSDVLVLTSGAHEIHGRNASSICAHLVVEACWNAVTPAAAENLEDRSSQVIPWSISTAGAVLGAYFESGDARIADALETLLARTHAGVEQALALVMRYSRDNKESVNQAARQMAVERVASCVRICR